MDLREYLFDKLWLIKQQLRTQLFVARAWLTRYPSYLIERSVDAAGKRYADLRFAFEVRQSRCQHTEIKVLNAEQYKTPYAYSYWIAHLKCRDCPEEWRVQARTPGLYSSDPKSEYYLDSSR